MEFMSVFILAGGAGCCPVCPGQRRLPRGRSASPSVSSGWSVLVSTVLSDDFQAVPQGRQPEFRVVGFRVDLEQAADGVLPSRSLAWDRALAVGIGPGQNRRPGMQKALASTWS